MYFSPLRTAAEAVTSSRDLLQCDLARSRSRRPKVRVLKVKETLRHFVNIIDTDQQIYNACWLLKMIYMDNVH